MTKINFKINTRYEYEMIVSEKAVRRALTVIEENAHRAGWDNVPAAMYPLYARGNTVWPGQPIVLPTSGNSPGQVLAWLACRMWSQAASSGVTAEFAGTGFCCEAWMAPPGTMTPEEIEAHDRGEGLGLADRLGTVEVRMAFVVDTSDRMIGLSRERGKAPQFNFDRDAGEAAMEWAGRIPAALRLLTLDSCRQLPAESHAIADIQARGDELFAQILAGETGGSSVRRGPRVTGL